MGSRSSFLIGHVAGSRGRHSSVHICQGGLTLEGADACVNLIRGATDPGNEKYSKNLHGQYLTRTAL